jgi:membrane fusion protein, multidrug efflux system
VAGAQASVHNVDAQMSVQQAQINANQAQVDLELARVTWDRDRPLVHEGWATAQLGTTDVQNLKAQHAAVESAQATLKLAQRQMDALEAQRETAEANLSQARAQRDQAELNLSYTKILAPVDGMIAQRSVQVGNYVSAGAALMAVVPLSEVYIEANYREVQLRHVRAGQRPHSR